MIEIAYAMGQGGAESAQGAGSFTAFIPLLLMFAIFYFLLIRPQQKRAKEHRDMISALKKGDKIMTSGGIHGRILSVDDSVLSVEIADKVKIKMDSSYVASLLQSVKNQPSKDADSQELKTK